METKLTDFSYPDLMYLSVIIENDLKKQMGNVDFLMTNLPESDLLPIFKENFDKSQRLLTQVKSALVTVKMQEIIQSN